MHAAAADIDSHSATAAEFRVQLAHFRRHFGADYHSFTTQFATFVMVNSETMVAAENHPNFGRGSHAALAVGNESEAQWAWPTPSPSLVACQEAVGDCVSGNN